MFTRALILIAALIALPAQATEEFFGTWVRYTGTGSGDDTLLFTTGDLDAWDKCWLMSTDGAVDVEVTLDGTSWSTAPLSLQDFGATDNTSVLVTVASRVYGWQGKPVKVRVRQNGGGTPSATLNCWK